MSSSMAMDFATMVRTYEEVEVLDDDEVPEDDADCKVLIGNAGPEVLAEALPDHEDPCNKKDPLDNDETRPVFTMTPPPREQGGLKKKKKN